MNHLILLLPGNLSPNPAHKGVQDNQSSTPLTHIVNQLRYRRWCPDAHYTHPTGIGKSAKVMRWHSNATPIAVFKLQLPIFSKIAASDSKEHISSSCALNLIPSYSKTVPRIYLLLLILLNP
jgi:hypothetical protein